MPKMIATKPQSYGRQVLAAGDEFEVADQFVQTLISLGRATLKDKPSTKTGVTGTKSKTDEPEADAEAGKGKYATRRLKAED